LHRNDHPTLGCAKSFLPSYAMGCPASGVLQRGGHCVSVLLDLDGKSRVDEEQCCEGDGDHVEGRRNRGRESRSLYSLVLGLEGTSVLNGTTNEERMAGDLMSLSTVGAAIEGVWKEKWEEWLSEFKDLIGEF